MKRKILFANLVHSSFLRATKYLTRIHKQIHDAVLKEASKQVQEMQFNDANKSDFKSSSRSAGSKTEILENDGEGETYSQR